MYAARMLACIRILEEGEDFFFWGQLLRILGKKWNFTYFGTTVRSDCNV